jgi:hypothetical protein
MTEGFRNKPRFSEIFLISVLLFSNLSFAQSLEGDWVLESEVESESKYKSAFSLALVEPQESTSATLGIRGDKDVPIEFFLIVATKQNDASCHHDVVEAQIDSISLPLVGLPQATEISNIKTTANDQRQFWNLFRSGENLTIVVKQVCDPLSEFHDNRFRLIFSLKGSKAAFDFVFPDFKPESKKTTSQKTNPSQKHEHRSSQENTIDQIDRFPGSGEEDESYKTKGFLFVFTLIAIWILWSITKGKREETNKPTIQVGIPPIVGDIVIDSSVNEIPLQDEAFKYQPSDKKIIIEGQLETLKNLRKSLSEKGITRFSSIADINGFIHGYDNEVKITEGLTRELFEDEYRKVNKDVDQLQLQLDEQKEFFKKKLEEEIQSLGDEIKLLQEKSDNSFFKKLFNSPSKSRLIRKKKNLENNSNEIIQSKTSQLNKELIVKKNKLDELSFDKEKIIQDRCSKSVKELSRIKNVVDGLYPIIAGAIGEKAVLNVLSKLSDEFYLINDFSMKFDPPIYNKKENDRIFSVQIDHLLISNSGLFVIETKNWSKKSVNTIDLRSPVQQILRTSYALFVLLNGKNGFSKSGLDHHHWGSKKIPIKNAIVMTNAKPTQEFNFVKIVSVNKLVGYIQYFDDVLSKSETSNLFTYLKAKNTH